MMHYCRVLVVDDEEKIQKLYEQKFYDEIEEGGLEFDFATGGEVALRLLRRNKYDVVYTDINMPGMNGLQLLEKIKTLMPHMAVIMVTAYGDMENIRLAMNNGAFDFITKPINFDDLKKTLVRSCSISRQLAEVHRMRSDYHGAELILNSILPEGLCETELYQVAGKTRPAQIVGGDFYHYMQLPDGRMTMNIADVCGKGLPAALFMYYVHNLYRVLLSDHNRPGALLRELNRFIIESAQSNQFVTMTHLQLSGNELVISSAGHCPVMVHRCGSNALEYYKAGGRPLGVMDAFEHEDLVVSLRPGDMVIAYSDGLTEAVNTEGDFFGEERLEASVLANHGKEIDRFLDAVYEDIDSFAGDADQFDDMTLMVLRMLPAD